MWIAKVTGLYVAGGIMAFFFVAAIITATYADYLYRKYGVYHQHYDTAKAGFRLFRQLFVVSAWASVVPSVCNLIRIMMELHRQINQG